MDFLKKKIGPMERVTRCGILPLTYNNSLSYYETICALIYKVNEIIAYFDGITKFATVEYVDTAINGVLGTLNTIKEQLETAVRRAAVACYAAEGAYPQDLAYMQQQKLPHSQ